MDESPYSFDPVKAVEAIAYTTRKAGTDLYETLKLIYLADKLHLQKYGRFMFGDWYCAMEYGPVGSNAYDAMKVARGKNQSALAKHAAEVFKVDPVTNKIALVRDPDTDELSRSELRCIDEAVGKYGTFGFSGLKNLTHDAAYKATPLNGKISMAAIASTFKDSAELIQHLSDRNPDRS